MTRRPSPMTRSRSRSHPPVQSPLRLGSGYGRLLGLGILVLLAVSMMGCSGGEPKHDPEAVSGGVTLPPTPSASTATAPPVPSSPITLLAADISEPGQSGFAGAPDLAKEALSGEWDLGGGRWLLRSDSKDGLYALWVKGAPTVKLVAEARDTDFVRAEGENLVFRSTKSPNAELRFPYCLVYDPQIGYTVGGDPVFLPLTQEVTLGCKGWIQVLSAVHLGPDMVGFELPPKAGTIAAGGWRFPVTKVDYDEKTMTVDVTFADVTLSSGIVSGQVFRLDPVDASAKVKTVTISSSADGVKASISLTGVQSYNVARNGEKKGYPPASPGAFLITFR